jgi:hypothetical protein
MLNVIVLIVVMLNVVVLNVIMLRVMVPLLSVFSTLMLSVIMLSVIMQSVIVTSVFVTSVIVTSVIVTSVIVTSVIMLSVIMLSVIMLSFIVMSFIVMSFIVMSVIVTSVIVASVIVQTDSVQHKPDSPWILLVEAIQSVAWLSTDNPHGSRSIQTVLEWNLLWSVPWIRSKTKQWKASFNNGTFQLWNENVEMILYFGIKTHLEGTMESCFSIGIVWVLYSSCSHDTTDPQP